MDTSPERKFYICKDCGCWGNFYWKNRCTRCEGKDLHIMPKHIPREQRIKYITNFKNRNFKEEI